ncbi:MAG: hypothetical protein B6243_06995 [Anaerolineaceae bacterium 4572_5.2]|nr:MAG: hypothetical protein B6243_06995 [Anaerolineaceae bacterium 4572_5.2]
MKKLLLILVGVGITLTALAGVGFAFAQGSTPPPVSNPQMPDGFGGRGNRLGQIEDNPLHDLMTAAMADIFGLTVDEFETMRENGETLWTLAEAQGLTQEEFQAEFQAKITEARENALQQAVEDGLISQERADQMRSRWENARGSKRGPGRGSCQGSEFTPQDGFRGAKEVNSPLKMALEECAEDAVVDVSK